MEITRDDLHKLVDHLPECEWEVSYWVLLAHLKQHDPMLWRLMTAPEDDEELTEEEVLAIEEGKEDFRNGNWITQEELEERLRDLP